MARTVGIENLDFETLWEDIEYEYAGTVFSVKYAGRGDLFEGLSVWQLICLEICEKILEGVKYIWITDHYRLVSATLKI